MKKSMLLAGAALLLTAAATPARGQAAISPGMTAEQVRDRFGQPATTRVAGEWVYWYYHNGCPVRCGSDDVVFFRNERVVAAVLRTARRSFTGPAADDALERAGGSEQVDAAPADGRARVGGVRVEQPATELIVTPSRSDDADRARPRAREGQPGEPSTIVITNPESTAGAPGTNPPDVDGPLPATRQTGATTTTPAPQNAEAADTRGETSIDRKNRRTRQDRSNEPTATQRARQNDRKDP
jgi:hypothetical protein